jgi:hypothetical protein
MGNCCAYLRVPNDDERDEDDGTDFEFTLRPRAPCCVSAPLSVAEECSNIVATAADLRLRVGDNNYRPARDDYDWLIVHVAHAALCVGTDEEYSRTAIEALDMWAREARRGKWQRRRQPGTFPF